jgi:sugar O-acyltransferase (sialic acid O-acetyltransferase NeuD family)
MDKKKKLIIVGTSANSKLAKFYFTRDTEYEVVAFAVNKEFIKSERFEGLPVIPIETIKVDFPPNVVDVFVAVGYTAMNSVREKLYFYCKKIGYLMPNYISPNCTFLSEESIGDNNFILEDNTIQPFVEIGSNNVFWSGNHIGHDSKIGDHNFITSHVVISGFTELGNNCFIGVNSTLRDSIKIADGSLIAAGAVVMKSTEKEDVILPPKSVTIDKKSSELKIS